MPKEVLMRRAIALARAHDPAPNPRVGAVVVKDGRIIGEGAHHRPGEPHAEVNAIAAAGAEAAGADLYVTLEPCCHRGGGKRTPACTDLITKSKIRRVIIASEDPNPEVSGKGIARLKAGGAIVVSGILVDEERELNREYHHFRRSGRPWVHLKQAVSLDGFIAARPGARTMLSGDEALTSVHRLRAAHQAILCGGSTVVIDDPELTVRRTTGRSPLRLVLEGRYGIPDEAKVFNTSNAGTILYTKSDNSERLKRLEASGVEIVAAGAGGLNAVLENAAGRGIISILVEGGGRLASAFIEADLVDELSLFYAPVMLGDGVPMASGRAAAFPDSRWKASNPLAAGSDIIMNWRRRGDDLCLPD